MQQDYIKAAELFEKVAEQGSIIAQYNLGTMYQAGEGVPQDYSKAAKWYQKAADQGSEKAQYCLGGMYYNGIGVTQDYVKAFELVSKAASKDHTEAQFNLAVMYYNGQGVTKDNTKAFELFTNAAEKGNADAQYSLGFMYYNGIGVMQDYKKAAEWYKKSAEQGNADAKEALRKINKRNNYPHIKLSVLSKDIIGIAANNLLNDSAWQIFGYQKVPTRGALFNVFVKSDKLSKETFLRRELVIVPLGIYVVKLSKMVDFSKEKYIKFLASYFLDFEGVSNSLRFNCGDEAKNYFVTYIYDYVLNEDNLYAVFIRHCKYNDISIDNDMIIGGKTLCDFLYDYFDRRIEETENNLFIENDLF